MTENPKDIPASRKYGRYYTYVEPIVADPVIRGYFTLVASMLLVAFFILFALSPTFSTIVGLFRKIDDQKEILQTLDNKINSLVLAQENYSKIEPDLPILDLAVPSKPIPGVVLLGVLNSASSSGVSITSFQIGEVYLSGINPDSKTAQAKAKPSATNNLVNSPLGIPVVTFSIGVRGSKDEIRQFVGKLQARKRILLISNLSIGKGTKFADDTGEPSANISGNAFYIPEGTL